MSELGFLILAIVTLGGAIGVVTARSVFVSALWLIVSLMGVAGFYLSLDAGFLGAVQVLVYVGAISVLILFAVMLTPNLMEAPAQLTRSSSLALIIALSIFGLLAVAAFGTRWPVSEARVVPAGGLVLAAAAEEGTARPPYLSEVRNAAGETETRLPDPVVQLGKSFMSDQLLAFEVISVILLVALLGAILIARE
jgi:NADH-quinone oxidoreductase subunit J